MDEPAFRVAKEAFAVAFELVHLSALLNQAQGNMSKAADLAGMDRKYLRGLVDQHGLRGFGIFLDGLGVWVEDDRADVPPNTPPGQRLDDVRRQWQRLLLSLDDGNIEANSRRERELRRLLLAYKNSLFASLDAVARHGVSAETSSATRTERALLCRARISVSDSKGKG